MGRKVYRKWKAFAWFFVSSLGALFYSIKCSNATSDSVYSAQQHHVPGDQHHSFVTSSKNEACKAKFISQKFLVLVSTLDGKLSALDALDHGRLHWSVSTDPRPLLSSSISNLEINQNGIRKKLIPSLDGTLYQYDGDSIEAIPMTADALLSSSFKVSDRTMMVGGKDITSFGIDPKTGKLRYFCTADGCKILEGEDPHQDMLVVTKSMQTVRSVDPRTGLEKWNFSVGNHQIEMLPGDKKPHETRPVEDEEDVCSQTCQSEEMPEALDTEDSIKIIVPEGMVVALNPDHPDVVDWKHKFESPVAKAWILRNGVLKTISVFDNKHIPALPGVDSTKDSAASQPLLYVGKHLNQFYVQASIPMQETVTNAAQHSHGNPLAVPRVSWRPLLNTAPSRTPIFRGNRREPGELPMITNGRKQDKETGLTVWNEHYPFDNGYYLYPDVSLPANICDAQNETADSMPNVIYMSLWNYWKEVLVISILMSVFMNLTISKLRKIYKKKHMSNEKEATFDSLGSLSDDKLDGMDKKSDLYDSRYKTDFEQLQVLGKGGFGIVFEARNKVDECCYAIKRITLPINEKSRDKMKREVRALAKLDHPGIVRYFQAWEESPPAGWQESRDQEMFDSECTSIPTPCNSTTQFVVHDSKVNSHADLKINESVPHNTNNLFGGGISNDARYVINYNQKAGGSEEFSVTQAGLSVSKSESGNLMFGQLIEEDSCSLDVEFRLDDSDDSGSFSHNIVPFSKLTHSSGDTVDNSFSIVFEDSGCADKSEKSTTSSGGVVFQDDSNHNNKHVIDTPSSSKLTSSSSSRPKTLSELRSHSARKLDSSSPVQKSYLYIQMQLCRRETLKDWLCASTNECRSSEEIWDMFGQIVSAVEYVHDSGLMHRDLKPSNIFFSYDGVIKIGDFGLVTDLTQEEVEECSTDYNPFRKHTAQVGTTLYMSPEQMAGKPYGQKVDIFSLGMILFEMLYSFSTQMERVRTLMEIKKRIFPDDFKSYSEEYKFVDWLVSFDPTQRPSATEIMSSKLLEKFRSQHPPKSNRDRTISSSSSGSLSGLHGHDRSGPGVE